MTSPLPVADRATVRSALVADLRAERGSVIMLMVINGFASAAGLVGPWLLGRIIDTLRSGAGATLGTIDRLAVSALAFTLVQIVLNWWALRLGYRFGERTAARVRERFLRRTLMLPPRIVDHLPTGELITRGSSDASLVATVLRSAVPEVLVAVVHGGFLIIAVLVLDPRLGVCGLASLVGVGAVLRWYLRRARPAYLAVAASGAELADVVSSTADGARTVDLLGLQARRRAAAEHAVTHARTARLDALWLRTVLFSWSDVSLAVPVVAVLLIGGALYAGGLVSLGAVVAATIYLRQLVGPLDTVMLWIEQLQGAGASYARVEGLPDTLPDRPQRSAAPHPPYGPIRVRNAHFSYRGDHDVLHGIELTVRTGERLAVVGASGAGKSTLARLLAGLDRPHIGSITVGDLPIADLPPDELRAQVVLITQDHHVFHDTVRDNLLIARPDATDLALSEALHAVGADWLGELPHGLDTMIGRDLILDGPRAQQLSLARVVLADPHTVILDEATALLDPGTARRAEQSLAAVLHGRTVIAIAHRLRTAHDADRIAVLDAGELVELGTHDELVEADRVYGRLWHSWHGGDRA